MNEAWKGTCDILAGELFSVRDRLDALCARMTEYAEQTEEFCDYSEEADRAENAARTLESVRRTVEEAISGIGRLTGG